MRTFGRAILAAAVMLGLLAGQPAQAKVYKMKPEERAAALKEKRAKRTKAKKEGKPAPGQDLGGWVEVKPGQGLSKKNRKSKVDEIAKQAEEKGKKKSRHSKAAEQQSEARPEKAVKKSKKGKKAAAEEAAVEKAAKPEKKSKKSKAERAAEAREDKKAGKGKKSKHSSARGDRAVGSGYAGERKISASSTEVRREAPPAAAVAPGQKADDLSGYSVSRPGQEKTPAAQPEVRHEIQTGPLDTSKPVGSEQKSGEGRF
jgi:hypothetical protein